MRKPVLIVPTWRRKGSIFVKTRSPHKRLHIMVISPNRDACLWARNDPASSNEGLGASLVREVIKGRVARDRVAKETEPSRANLVTRVFAGRMSSLAHRRCRFWEPRTPSRSVQARTLQSLTRVHQSTAHPTQPLSQK